MLIPSHFSIKDEKKIFDFIDHYSFATLINRTDRFIEATHVPLQRSQMNGKTILSGHLNRTNPQLISFTEKPEVLAIFQGPHGYISSDWYNHDNVPTWNYSSVHMKGRASVIECPDEFAKQLEILTNKYQKKIDSKNPYKKLNQKVVTHAFRGIFGFKIEVTEIKAKFKMSQNRSCEELNNICKKLEDSPEKENHILSEFMKDCNNLKG